VEEVDVIVVGAGLAGLACALRLTAAGRTVALLEASDTPGGRVRTDVVDGWRLDRGFQVHDTAYPELDRLLDSPALDLRAFTTGAVVHIGAAAHRIADPRRHPRAALATLRAPIGGLRDKVRTGALATRVALTPARRLLAAPETSTAEALAHAGLSPTVVQRFWRPYLAGVFLERELATSSRFFSFVLRCQARGTQCLPGAGIGAIPAQLADRLPAGVLRTGTPVACVGPGAVTTQGGERLSARAVVVAVDPLAAHRLLPALGPPPSMTAVTTVYLAAPSADAEPVLHLEGNGPVRGPLVNAVVLPSVQPGRLLSASVLGPTATVPAVRNHLRQWHGAQVDDWEHLATVSVPHATVLAAPPQGRLRRTTQVAAGLHVCGDHRDSPSTQGAAVSGRRTADAILQELH